VPALLQALRSQRDTRPQAGVAWAVFAARHGQGTEVAAWTRAEAARLPAQALIDLLLLAVERAEAGLGRVVEAALTGRTDLPPGWSAGEIALTVHAKESLTLQRLREGLALIGDPRTVGAARDRVAALLVGARDFAKVTQGVRVTASDGAVVWLQEAADADGPADVVAARLDLLAGVAPQHALATLARRSAADPQRFAPLYAATLLRSGQGAEASAVLTAALHGVGPKRQDAVLQDVLARVSPGEPLPVLRIGAGSGREDWVAAYEDGLMRAGRLDELRSELRARAALPGASGVERQALAARLIELHDRVGALGILRAMASGRAPDDTVVEQLMYLWGPRADSDAVAWTQEQASAASPDRLAKWLDHLAYLGDPAAVVSVVESRPGVLGGSAAVVRIYGAALIASHAKAKPDLRAAIVAAAGPERLAALAQLALDTGQAAPAWQAAQGALAAAPSDAAALLRAAQAAALVRRSEDAAALYVRLLALGRQPVEVCVDAGDALLTAKRTEQGRQVLSAALTRVPANPATLADARLRARALMLLRRNGEAVDLLNAWLASFPNHAGLRADLLQSRLDVAESSR